jgi:hypothetical protein
MTEWHVFKILKHLFVKSFLRSTFSAGCGGRTYNASTWEAEIGGLQVQDQSGLYREVCLKTNKQTNQAAFSIWNQVKPFILFIFFVLYLFHSKIVQICIWELSWKNICYCYKYFIANLTLQNQRRKSCTDICLQSFISILTLVSSTLVKYFILFLFLYSSTYSNQLLENKANWWFFFF